MEHTNHIKNQKILYSKFTKNPITLQTSSNKFQLQSKHAFQITHQTKQFSVMQQKIMKRHSKKSGYNVKLQYKPINQNTNNKINRKINIIWFNPPFSETVSAKIGHYFLSLLYKHFPKNHKFHSIFNKNNVKISYRCTNHKTIFNKSETLNKRKWNCIIKHQLPLNGKRQAENFIWTQINLIMTKYTTRMVEKPLLKNDSPIIKNHLTTSNIKMERNFQRKYGSLSQKITTQRFPGKSYEDAPL